jgi:uncharacterized membrane protein YdjX (TVP38/TMEM64 family)
MLRKKSVWVLLVWFIAAVIVLILLKTTGFFEQIELDEWGDWLRDLGLFGGILYILAYTLRPLVLFPATPLTLFGGYVFGAFWGTIYDVIGAGAGALLSFVIARKWGRSSVERLIKRKKLQTFDDKAKRNGFMVVLYMRLMPFFPFDGVSYGAGLSKVRGWDYTLATLIGIIPGAVVYNVFGASLNNIGSAGFYWAVLLYAVFALVPLWFRYRKRKKFE